MSGQSRALDLNVTREKSEIVDELMGYRNEKIESDVDYPTSHKVTVMGHGNPAEDAFYRTFANSKLSMGIEPCTGFEDPQNLAYAMEMSENAEINLRAKVEGIQDHAPVVQTGIEALEEAGFEPHADIDKQKSYGGSAQEAIDQLEEEGIFLNIWSNSDPVNEHPDSHYVTASYHPDSQTLEPNVQICAPAMAAEGETEEISRRMEEALDEVDLLR